MFFPFDMSTKDRVHRFSYSHGGHFHDPYAPHIGHYSQDAAHSPINIDGADYRAPYIDVATEDQHVPYQPRNTSDADYDNPTVFET